ncbi:antitoxin [Streptomyces sp. 378]|uniref:antitoxin n=1 Tax=Streptomyces sp. 378 TaxID=3049412 RepID=UPI0024C342E5|nr:antitoxin [Streptomyces sp. 378]MDK1346833.1 antitoxin [Streptomyces sp. 378]
MGLLDNVKAKLGPAKGKVSDLAQRHEGKIHHGLDKAAQAVDKRTKGKYSDRIQSGTGRAKGAMERLTHKEDGAPNTGGTTPSGARGTTPPPTAGGTPPPEAPPPTS